MQRSSCDYAGVLPYAHLPDGSVLFLLGRERHERGWDDGCRWSDFGGGPEPHERCVLKSIAARECYEESMGLFGTTAEVERALDERRSFAAADNGGRHYLLEIPYDPLLPLYYRRALHYLMTCSVPHPDRPEVRVVRSCPEGYLEKVDMAWCAPSYLLSQNKVRVESCVADGLRPKFAAALLTFADAHPELRRNQLHV